jgi:hypothetical protein
MGRFGVWGQCDVCGEDSWVVPWERDYLDEPISWVCGGGCDEETSSDRADWS